MVKRKRASIPEEDVKAINDSFKDTKDAQIITHNADKVPIGSRRGNVNAGNNFAIKSHSGKVLKHNKMLIPVGGKQVLIGAKGQKWDDIPLERRSAVTWFDSDFE